MVRYQLFECNARLGAACNAMNVIPDPFLGALHLLELYGACCLQGFLAGISNKSSMCQGKDIFPRIAACQAEPYPSSCQNHLAANL